MMALAMGTCFGQASTTVALSNGVQLQIEASFGRPTGQTVLKVEMAPASGNSFYRIFRDQNGLAIFAYEFAVAVGESGEALRVDAKPVLTEFAKRFPNANGGKPVPTFSETHPLAIEFGKSAKLGLFEMQGMGLTVVDTVTTKLESGNPSDRGSESVSSDRMQLSGARLQINGMPVSNSGPRGSVIGRYLMIYIPGRGAFILSAAPVPNRPFVSTGTIAGNVMDFMTGNGLYEVTSSAPILAHSKSSGLWVYHDASYKPVGNWTQALQGNAPTTAPEQQFFAAASDSLSWWLR